MNDQSIIIGELMNCSKQETGILARDSIWIDSKYFPTNKKSLDNLKCLKKLTTELDINEDSVKRTNDRMEVRK